LAGAQQNLEDDITLDTSSPSLAVAATHQQHQEKLVSFDRSFPSAQVQAQKKEWAIHL
jgi:hypothetical protein